MQVAQTVEAVAPEQEVQFAMQATIAVVPLIAYAVAAAEHPATVAAVQVIQFARQAVTAVTLPPAPVKKKPLAAV